MTLSQKRLFIPSLFLTQHFDNLQDNVPAEVLGHLLSVVPKVAEIKGVNESGFRCVINTGPDSAATVGHLHIHVIPRYSKDDANIKWTPGTQDVDKLNAIAEKVQKIL